MTLKFTSTPMFARNHRLWTKRRLSDSGKNDKKGQLEVVTSCDQIQRNIVCHGCGATPYGPGCLKST